MTTLIRHKTQPAVFITLSPKRDNPQTENLRKLWFMTYDLPEQINLKTNSSFMHSITMLNPLPQFIDYSSLGTVIPNMYGFKGLCISFGRD